VKYAAIADWAGDKQHSVSLMCAQLGVARQGYYRWLTDGPSEHDRTDTQLTDQIPTTHAELRPPGRTPDLGRTRRARRTDRAQTRRR
jgi:hypothetical protein